MNEDGARTETETLQARVCMLEELLESKERVLADHAAKLEEALDQSRSQASLLRALVSATDPSHQDDFFHAIVYHLAAAIHMPYVVIGEFVSDGDVPRRVETRAVWSNGDFGKSFSYELGGMPCAGLVQERLICCEEGVQQRFPDAQLMKDLAAEGYVGLSLFDSTGNAIGVLALLDTKPLRLTQDVRSILTLFAARAGSEIERRRFEQEHAKARLNLRNIMDAVPDVLFTLDLQGHLSQWNSQAERVTGYSSQELAGKPALTFVPPEEAEQTIAAITKALTTGYAELEGHLLTKDRRTVAYHWTGAALTDTDGRVIGVSGVGRDVSELRRAKEESARQRRQLVHAQGLAHLGSWEWDVESGDVEWSDEEFRIFGHEPGTVPVTYDSVLASILPDDHDRVLAALNDALLGKRPYDIEYCIVRPSGEVRTLHSRGEVTRDADGHPLRMAGGTLDITDRKRTEEALRSSEERWQLAVRGTNDGIWDWNVQTGEVFFSSRWKSMRGFGDDEIAGHVDEWRSRIHPDDLDRVLQNVDAYLAQSAGVFCEEYRVLRKDGSYMWILDRGVALWDEKGTPVRMVGSESDITSRKHSEEALRESRDQYARATAAGKVGVWEYDFLASRHRSDENLKSLFGYGPGELDDDPMTWFHLIHPDDQPVSMKATVAIIDRTTDLVDYEIRMKHKDGHLIWTQVRGSAIRNEEGRALKLVGATVDITERKRAEQALQLSEQHIKSIIQASPECIKLVAADGTLLQINAAGLAMIEEERAEDAIGKCVYPLIASEDRDRFRALNKSVCQGVSASMEFQLEGRRGTRRWMETRAVPLRNPVDGAVVHLAVTRDITDRKKAEEELSVALENIRTITENIPDIMYKLDSSGKVIDWNRRVRTITGYTQEELMQKPALEFVPEDERPRLASAMRRVFESGSSEVACRLLTKDGRTIPYHWTGAVLKDRDGRVIGMTGVGRDITALKQAEAAVRESEARYKALVELSPAGVFVFCEGRTVYINLSGAVIMGASVPSQILERNTFDFVHPDFHAEVKQNVHRLLTGGASVHRAERVYLKLDGTPISVQVEAAPIVWNGKPAILGIFSDITERKKAEEALAHSERQLRTVLDTLPVGVWFTDATGKVVLSNPAGRKIWSGFAGIGIEMNEHQPRWWERFENAEEPHRWALARVLLRGEASLNETMEIECEDGSRKVINNSTVPVKDAAGQVTGAIIVNEDVTERKRGEESRAKLAAIVTSSYDAIMSLSLRGQIQSWNLGAEVMFGYTAEEILDQFVTVLAAGERRDDLVTAIHRAADGEPVHHVDTTLRGKTGEEIFVSLNVSPIVPHYGTVMSISLIARNVTDRRHAEMALQASEELFSKTFRSSPNPIGITEMETGRCIDVNDACLELFGYSREEVIGQTTLMLGIWPKPEDRAMLVERLKVGGPVRNMEMSFRTRSGDRRHVLVSSDLVEMNGRRCLVTVGSDITERTRVEEALRQREKDLQDALEERERISQDLHDGILQSLYAVGLGIEACRPLLKKDPAKALQACDKAVAQLNNVMREVRGFIADIDPEPEAIMDLRDALRSMVESMTQVRAMRVRLALSKQAAGSVPKENVMHLLNVVKEAVSNTIRHGHAKQTTVSLKRFKRGVRLAIQDDGAGFKPDRVRRGRGLDNMASRASKMGGRLTVLSKPKSGTRVIVDLPAGNPYAHA